MAGIFHKLPSLPDRLKKVASESLTLKTEVKNRSSCPHTFFQIGVLKNFAIFKENNYIKKRLEHRCFPMNIIKFLRIPLIEHLQWLLL